jgi:hypothetical protein
MVALIESKNRLDRCCSGQLSAAVPLIVLTLNPVTMFTSNVRLSTSCHCCVQRLSQETARI